jgi:hypothetical protein
VRTLTQITAARLRLRGGADQAIFDLVARLVTYRIRKHDANPHDLYTILMLFATRHKQNTIGVPLAVKILDSVYTNELLTHAAM